MNTGLTLSKLINSMDVFKNMSNDFPSQYILTFLLVAKNQGVSNKELVDKIGLSGAAISRNLSALSPHRKNGQPGYNLIDGDVHPTDARLRVWYLTEHGKEVLRQILSNFGHDENDPLPEATEPYGDRTSQEVVPPTYFAPKRTIYKEGEAS